MTGCMDELCRLQSLSINVIGIGDVIFNENLNDPYILIGFSHGIITSDYASDPIKLSRSYPCNCCES
jgi:hypothetical protein